MSRLIRMNQIEDSIDPVVDLTIIPIEIVVGETVLEFYESVIILN
jgi:hypothetical protein